jgi:DNA-binding MarR family transcriptional regulator
VARNRVRRSANAGAASPDQVSQRAVRNGSSGRYTYDAVEESSRRWRTRGWDNSDSMAAAVSLMYAAGLIRANLDETLRPFGLTYPRYEVLGVLSSSREGRLPMGKIAARWRVHPATLTSMVDRLEARRLVSRLPDPDDRRSIVAKITPAGEELFEKATNAVNATDFGLPGLTRTQLRELTGIIREVRRAYDGFA